MPCVTYYSDDDVRNHQSKLQDPEIQELLDEITAIDGTVWFVRRYEFTVRKWFRKPKTHVLYELLANTYPGEFQIINFPGEGIRMMVERDFVITYLMAYCGGYNHAKRMSSSA